MVDRPAYLQINGTKNRSSHTSSKQDPLKQAFKDINRPKINNWVAPIKQLPPSHSKAISDLRKELYECNPSTVRPNITSKERRIIREMKSPKTLVIKPADKGSGTVLWDINKYIAEAEKQLNTPSYNRLEDSIISQTMDNIDKSLRELLRLNKINKYEYTAMTQIDAREAEFYLLPKIHKD